METAMFAEMLENIQHAMQLSPESQRYTFMSVLQKYIPLK
jgi:hypothetical protein